MDQNQKTPYTPEENEARYRQKERKKKIVKIALICCVVIVVLYVATLSLNPDTLVDKWFRKDEQPAQNIKFYPIDEDLDILSDAEYLEYDRRVFYYDIDSGATFSVEEEDLPTLDARIRFFHDYFQTVILGDEEAYADCFVSDYDKPLPENFTMQMVYDIYIEPYYSDRLNEIAYRVEYKIHKNNGTFRNDMGSDVSRALLFVLAEEDGAYRIQKIVLFTSY
ncbi:MAG: hypothetical protein E7605_07930 [Ruminococcaceae bacterium]|nr:hypothetical protein [Oscillospiraceae bacterium]